MGEERTTRRHYLLGLGTAGAVGLTGCMADDRQEDSDQNDDEEGETEEAEETPEPAARPDFDGWLDGANNYDGEVVDARGQAEVTVEVGAGDNGLAFGPAAVHVDPGTTVVWKWTGRGGSHNVVAEDGTFDSGSLVNSGTFEHTFGKDGIYRYYCRPHKGVGMLGAVVVGDEYPTVESEQRDGTETSRRAPNRVDEYLADANGYDGSLADARGRDEVVISVGGGEGFAFDPAAVHVDPGTTVVWEWTGEGGAHNVVAEDGTFDSGRAVSEQGSTFEFTVGEDGIYTYYCVPHESLGMKGALVVGDPTADERSGDDRPQTETPASVGEYLADANNYDGTLADARGQAEVRLRAGGGDDGLAFDPPAIRVSPGTTVTWGWTGEGGAHNVVAEDGTFDSGSPQASGTFSHTFEESGIYRYYCAPHKGLGMKGAVIVGDG